jgi:UDP-GlcNAc3NAcA epimerase
VKPKVLSVVGARPQFVKAAPLSIALRGSFDEVLVHTGQHYDYGMSDVFFEELGMLAPDHHLGVGSGSHAAQTGALLRSLEEVMKQEAPDAVIVFGDTNSTLAGALAAAKLNIPVAHVEAGLRSFNRRMPEEINRVVADRLSTWLFVPSEASRRQLQAEGLSEGVYNVGDIMYDAVLQHSGHASSHSTLPHSAGLSPSSYYVCTVHRAENTEGPNALRSILTALGKAGAPVVMPVHPRTRKLLSAHTLEVPANVRLIEPLGYFDMLQLVRHSLCVLTDSGGLQKEAYYLGVPCVTLREETEWTETLLLGWNRLAGVDPERIVGAIEEFRSRPSHRPELYGDGRTAGRIAYIMVEELRG